MKELIGYVVLCPSKNNVAPWFIDTDASSGYPMFDKNINKYSRHVYSDVMDAFKEMKSVKKNMKTYYNAEHIDFDRIKVVKYFRVFEDVELDEQSLLVERAKNKLTEEELHALTREIAFSF